jgi:hypothetical protein
MRVILKEVLGKIGIFIVTLLCLAALLMASAMINPARMYDNLVTSARIIETEPMHAEASIVASQKDRAADGILFNMIWNTDPKHPVMSTIKAAYYERQDKDVTSAVEETLTGGKKANALYIRYWHGTETFVRLMLLVTDIRGIRIIQAVALTVIMLILMAVLLRKKILFRGHTDGYQLSDHQMLLLRNLNRIHFSAPNRADHFHCNSLYKKTGNVHECFSYIRHTCGIL